jgi:hypothetical protein
MSTVSRFVLWLLQLLSLGTILWCSWLLLDTTVFALVAASVVLFTTLYAEHRELTHGVAQRPSEGETTSS